MIDGTNVTEMKEQACFLYSSSLFQYSDGDELLEN